MVYKAELVVVCYLDISHTYAGTYVNKSNKILRRIVTVRKELLYVHGTQADTYNLVEPKLRNSSFKYFRGDPCQSQSGHILFEFNLDILLSISKLPVPII